MGRVSQRDIDRAKCAPVGEIWDRLGLPPLAGDNRNVSSPWRSDSEPSLQVGGPKNIVYDHGTGESLDPIALVRKERDLNFKSAVEWVLGGAVTEERPEKWQHVRIESKPAASGNRARSKWQAETAAQAMASARRMLERSEAVWPLMASYGLRRETVERCPVGAWKNQYGESVLYADSLERPSVVKSKSVSRNEHGKRYSCFKLGTAALWWPGGRTAGRPIVVTGGEEKAMLAMQELSWACVVSTLAGEGPDKLTADMAGEIATLDAPYVVVALDHDDTGLDAMPVWAERLRAAGVGDVRIVGWPEGTPEHYDLNDYFMARGGDALRALIDRAGVLPPPGGGADAARDDEGSADDADAEDVADLVAQEECFDSKNRPVPNRIAKYITQRRRPTLVMVKDRYWEYDGRVFVERDSKEVDREALRVCGDQSRQRLFSDVATIVRVAIFNNSFFDGETSSRYVQCLNGVVDVMSWDLLEHDPKYRARNLLPVEYRPEARCDLWLDFLDDVLSACGGKDSDLARREAWHVLQEWFGYCLVPRYTIHKFLVLTGEGRNGKSVTTDVLQRMLGPQNVVSVPLAQLESKETFPSAALDGKLLNLCPEADWSKVDVNWIKSLTGGDPVTVRKPYGMPFTLHNVARFVMTTNNSPRFTDRSKAIWDRLMVIHYGYEVPEDKRDPHMADKLWAEAPGILNWALDGLRRLMRNKAFSEGALIKGAKEDLRIKSDSVLSWIDECCEASGAEVQVTSADAYAAYAKWARNYGYHPQSHKNVIDTMRKHFGDVVRYSEHCLNAVGKRVRGFRGLRLLDD